MNVDGQKLESSASRRAPLPFVSAEKGQMLVLFVLALGALMGITAMVIDVGMFLHERRSLQSAADAAALAGVQELPESPEAAVSDARDWAERNGFDSSQVSVDINTPYAGNPNAIEVTIEEEMPFLFARVLGKESAGISARAVASRERQIDYGPAIFAYATGCGNPTEVQMSGADIDVVGDIISNGNVKISTSDIYAQGSLTYMCDDPLVQNATFTNNLNQVSSPVAWPVQFTYGDFTCDYTFNSTNVWQIRPSSTPNLYSDLAAGVLKPGVYCHDQDIVVSGKATGNVTFVSRAGVYIKGGPYNLTSYQNDVLIYAESPSTAVHISANGFTWEGIIFAPNGSVQFSAADAESAAGGIYGYTVKVSTSSITITGLPDDVVVFGKPKLVE